MKRRSLDRHSFFVIRNSRRRLSTRLRQRDTGAANGASLRLSPQKTRLRCTPRDTVTLTWIAAEAQASA